MNLPHAETRGAPSALRGGRRLGPLLALCLLCARPASAQQYLTVSLQVSVGDDGTIYATGIADARSMFEHSADISTAINSPRRAASADNTVSSGGYARADTLLPLDQTDTGDYTTTADGNANCPYAAGPASGSANKPIKVGRQQVRFVWDTTQNPAYGCVYDRNCTPAPAESYCGPTTFSKAQNPYVPSCYNFVSRRYFFIKVYNTIIFQYQLDGDLSSQDASTYPCDAPIPGYP